MTISRISMFALLAIKLLILDAISGEKQFSLIAPNVVLANEAMSAELKSVVWKKAEGTWTPATGDALIAIEHLKTDQAAKELLTCAGHDIKMDASLKRIGSSRYQVFGLIIDGGRKLLIDASPIQSTLDRFMPELWLKEIVSVRVQDGGAGYWWALYDVKSGRFVSCNRRPDT